MFRLQRIPVKIELILADLQIFFNDHQWLHFQSILLSLLLTPYRATVTGMFKILSFGTHRSKHNEFLNNSSEILSKVLKFYAMLILTKIKKRNEPIYFIIDDTTNKKRGKHIEAAFSFLEHTSKQLIWGQQLVCAIIKHRDFVIPFAIQIYVSTEKSKEMGLEFQKKTKIALNMLREFEADENHQVVVLADCYYAWTQIMNYCRRKNYSFVSVLKTNRVFSLNDKVTTVRKYVKRNFRTKKKKVTIKIKDNSYLTITRKVTLKTGGAVKVVFSKQREHRTALAVFTTNTALPAKRILEFYRNRWDIEVFFKMSKQNLGLKAYQNRNLNAIESYVRVSLCAHNLLTHVFINDLREKGKKLTKKNIAHFSVNNMIDRVRLIASSDTIDYCIEKNHSTDKLSYELKNLLLAA